MERITEQDLKRNNWHWANIDALQDEDPLFKTIDSTDTSWIVDNSGRLVPKSTVEQWLNSYERQTPYQEQPDNAIDLWYRKQLQHRLNQEFNRQVDHFFLGGWASPSQIIGAFNPYGDNSNTPFAERLLLGTGNTGIVSKNFAENHPYWSTAANLGFDLVAPSAVKGVGYVTKPEVISNVTKYITHPSYKTYYHGSPHPFDIKNFYTGTAHDVGLHVGDKNIATSQANWGRSGGTVYKIRAPKPNAETIDIWANNYRHLLESLKFEAAPYKGDNFIPLRSYQSYPGDRLRIKLLREQGVQPYFKENNMYTDKSASLNLRKQFPNIVEKFQKEADDILSEVAPYENSAGPDWWNSFPNKAAEINIKTADLLSKAGYKTVKYVNANSVERPYNLDQKTPYYSYFITDPKVIQVMQPWPKINFNTPLKLGATNAGLNITNNKE